MRTFLHTNAADILDGIGSNRMAHTMKHDDSLGIVQPIDTLPEVLTGGITIVRTSMLTGIERERFIDRLTEEALNDWIDGTVIQEAMPHVSIEDREFIISGIVPSEWHDAFGDEGGA